MSLDVTLTLDNEEVFSANITHNLNSMAEAAGIYNHVWRPEEIGIVLAEDLIIPLQNGIEILTQFPEQFETLNPVNGWGSYKGFIPWLESYLEACIRYPKATVSACR